MVVVVVADKSWVWDGVRLGLDGDLAVPAAGALVGPGPGLWRWLGIGRELGLRLG